MLKALADYLIERISGNEFRASLLSEQINDLDILLLMLTKDNFFPLVTGSFPLALLQKAETELVDLRMPDDDLRVLAGFFERMLADADAREPAFKKQLLFLILNLRKSIIVKNDADFQNLLRDNRHLYEYLSFEEGIPLLVQGQTFFDDIQNKREEDFLHLGKIYSDAGMEEDESSQRIEYLERAIAIWNQAPDKALIDVKYYFKTYYCLIMHGDKTTSSDIKSKKLMSLYQAFIDCFERLNQKEDLDYQYFITVSLLLYKEAKHILALKDVLQERNFFLKLLEMHGCIHKPTSADECRLALCHLKWSECEIPRFGADYDEIRDHLGRAIAIFQALPELNMENIDLLNIIFYCYKKLYLQIDFDHDFYERLMDCFDVEVDMSLKHFTKYFNRFYNFAMQESNWLQVRSIMPVMIAALELMLKAHDCKVALAEGVNLCLDDEASKEIFKDRLAQLKEGPAPKLQLLLEYSPRPLTEAVIQLKALQKQNKAQEKQMAALETRLREMQQQLDRMASKGSSYQYLPEWSVFSVSDTKPVLQTSAEVPLRRSGPL